MKFLEYERWPRGALIQLTNGFGPVARWFHSQSVLSIGFLWVALMTGFRIGFGRLILHVLLAAGGL